MGNKDLFENYVQIMYERLTLHAGMWYPLQRCTLRYCRHFSNAGGMEEHLKLCRLFVRTDGRAPDEVFYFGGVSVYAQ